MLSHPAPGYPHALYIWGDKILEMAEIRLVKSHSIILVTYHQTIGEEEHYFQKLSDLAKFFNEWKRWGELVGYVIIKNRPPGFNDQLMERAKLIVEWVDEINSTTRKHFDNVYAMTDFFEQHPKLAEAVGYIKVKKN